MDVRLRSPPRPKFVTTLLGDKRTVRDYKGLRQD